jgi:hypothetical protein
MVRDFCDRCGIETTGAKSGSITGCDDADRDGDGRASDHFEILCPKCYRAVIAFIRAKVPTDE